MSQFFLLSLQPHTSPSSQTPQWLAPFCFIAHQTGLALSARPLDQGSATSAEAGVDEGDAQPVGGHMGDWSRCYRGWNSRPGKGHRDALLNRLGENDREEETLSHRCDPLTSSPHGEWRSVCCVMPFSDPDPALLTTAAPISPFWQYN